MASNSKNFYDISYSIKIGPSIYHVLGRRMKNVKNNNTYFLAEDATTRSKSVIVPTKPSTCIPRSKSLEQSVSTNCRPHTSHNRSVIIDADLTTKPQQQKSDQIRRHHHRYTKSKSKHN